MNIHITQLEQCNFLKKCESYHIISQYPDTKCKIEQDLFEVWCFGKKIKVRQFLETRKCA